MSTRTLAELMYLIASVAVTLTITWYSAWGYPQGGTAIWSVGLVAMAFVAGMGLKPFLASWRIDRAEPAADDDA